MKKLSELMSEQAVKQHQLSVARFEAINNECMDIYAKKNLDYGNSFDISLDEDGLLVAKIRLGDKMKRFASLIKNPQQVKDESIRDTLIDMANYAKMTVMWMDAKAEIEQVKKMVAAGSMDSRDGEITVGDSSGQTIDYCW